MSQDERSLRASLRALVGHGLALDVELEAGPGATAIVGPNGAGKTSLLSLLLGVLPAREGRFEVSGEVLYDREAGVDVPSERRRLGYVPQEYGLFPHLDVRANVAFGLTVGPRASDVAAREAKLAGLMNDLGLTPLAKRRPRTLSGGEKQRVALARALAISPRALLLDEPLAALDAHARREVRAFLAPFLRSLAVPTLLVTHDAADVRALAERIVVLEAGRITQSGTWAELEAAPASAFVRAFLQG